MYLINFMVSGCEECHFYQQFHKNFGNDNHITKYKMF